MVYAPHHSTAGSWGYAPQPAPTHAQAPQAPGQAPPYPGPAYMPQPMDYTERQTFSITRATVPLLMFFGALVTVVGISVLATRTASTLESTMVSGFATVTATLQNYISRNDERMTRVEDLIESRERTSWTKQDQRLFCAETASLPENKGWRCADPGEAPIWRGLNKSSDVTPVTPGPALSSWPMATSRDGG